MNITRVSNPCPYAVTRISNGLPKPIVQVGFQTVVVSETLNSGVTAQQALQIARGEIERDNTEHDDPEFNPLFSSLPPLP